MSHPVPGARTIVHLVRHGEVHNPDRILYGRLPGFRLSERGERQAELTARWLADRDLRHLVSSPLERALQTARPLAELTGLPVEQDAGLLEASNAFEGRPVAGGSRAIAAPANWMLLRNPFTPSWGEPYTAVAARMMVAVRSARDAAAGHEAVCVSHQLPIVALRRSVLGQRLWHDPRRRHCALASVTSLTFEGHEVVAVGYAEPAGATPAGYVSGA